MNAACVSSISAIALAVTVLADRNPRACDRVEEDRPPELVWMAAGSFPVGSPAGEKDRLKQEGPQTWVTLSHGFWMGRFEVTQAQFQAVMGRNPSRFRGDLRRPVEQVSWLETRQYCARLTEQERRSGRLPAGYCYRLPTEVEWEYAARAGTETRFSFGDDPQYARLGQYAWFSQNSGGTTHPVGAKLPNAWGLHDMLGNVEEWCLDGWRNSLAGLAIIDPRHAPAGKYRVIRGGSWRDPAKKCRTASRDYAWPEYREKGTTGFRVVLARAPQHVSER